MDNSLINEAGYCDRNAAATAFISVSSICFAIAAVLVPLRIYTRLYVVKAFGWDDATLILSYIVFIPTCAFLWELAALGLGRHGDCLSESAALQLGKYEYVAEVLEIYCVILSRASAALFVLRLFGVSRWLKIALTAWTTFMVISLGITGILIFLECTPASAIWDLSVQGSCWSVSGRAAVDDFNGAVSIASDFILALLPAYFLWNLQMAPRLKVAVSSLFALGLLPGTCAILRTALSYTQTATDPIRDNAILIVFGSLETAFLIICTAAPALPSLFTDRHKTTSSDYRHKFNKTSGKQSGPMSYPAKSSDKSDEDSDIEGAHLPYAGEASRGGVKLGVFTHTSVGSSDSQDNNVELFGTSPQSIRRYIEVTVE